jgi:hypothetical protein
LAFRRIEANERLVGKPGDPTNCSGMEKRSAFVDHVMPGRHGSQRYHDRPQGYIWRRPMEAEIEVKRARLAAIERELSGLGARHDLAMSAFRFDEAREVQQRITILQRERAELVKALPAATPPPPRRQCRS